MQRYRRRRRLPFGLGFWVVIVGGCALAGAWKLHLIPIEFGDTETGTISEDGRLRQAGNDKLRTGADGLPPGQDDSFVNVDPVVFSAQAEPFAGDAERHWSLGKQRGAPVATEGSLEAHHWDDPSPPILASPLPVVLDESRTPPISPATVNAVATREDTGQIEPVIQASATDTPPAARMEDTAPAHGLRTASRDATSHALPVDSAPDLATIDALIEAGDDVVALREMSTLYWSRPETRSQFQERLESIADKIYFSPQPHYMTPYIVQPGDQMRKIADQYKVSWMYLARMNRVEPRRMRAGRKLKVIKGPFAALIDLSDFELTIHLHGYFVRRYRVGIGRDNLSPIGTFSVLNKVIDPQYTDPQGKVIASDDPTNPLGERWIEIGDGFGIHGTIHPESIGRAQSRGCIRMLNEEVEEVYELLTIGSEVVIQR